jgi:hypothetical protein
MMKRQPDGKWRGRRQAVVISAAVLRARWIEDEALHLKIIGLPFRAIAEHITRVGRSQTQPLTKMSEGVTFPLDYTISRQACFKAIQKALGREQALKVEQLRKIDYARSEELFASLQPGIRKGKVREIEAAIKVLDHSAKVNNLAAAQSGREAIIEESGPRREPGLVLGTFFKAFELMAEYGVVPPGYFCPRCRPSLIEAQGASLDGPDLGQLDEGNKENEE